MASAVPGSNWEEVLMTWSSGPSRTEQTKCENAEGLIKKAIAASTKLSTKNIRVFVQGSYRHRTNVRQESDVDVCVCLRDTVSTKLTDGITLEELGFITPASYQVAEFKNDVEKALRACVGSGGITRGKKAFDVHANTYRVDADVVPTLEHRWYYRDANGKPLYVWGTAIDPDGGGRIINWPEHAYGNGVKKNDDTNRHYKRVVRILKRLRNEMSSAGIVSASKTPSFLIDCLVWNVLDDFFDLGSYEDDLRESLVYVFNKTLKSEDCADWKEVNGIKLLFDASQPWTREQAHAFVSDAWKYVGIWED